MPNGLPYHVGLPRYLGAPGGKDGNLDSSLSIAGQAISQTQTSAWSTAMFNHAKSSHRKCPALEASILWASLPTSSLAQLPNFDRIQPLITHGNQDREVDSNIKPYGAWVCIKSIRNVKYEHKGAHWLRLVVGSAGGMSGMVRWPR